MKINSIFVLGSSSLIAKEICLALAKEGCRKFHLITKNQEKNIPLINELRNAFKATVTEEIIDLEDQSVYIESLPFVDDFDLYLITAGTLGNNEKAKYDFNEAIKICNVNFLSLIPWLISITKIERLKKKSSLWVFSSVASDRGRPSNYIYGSAKAGLSNYCEGLISRCNQTNFKVRLIKAGYILTPNTEGKAPKALCTKPKSVAKYLLRNKRKSGVEYLPWWWFFIMKTIKLLPNRIVSKL